MKHICLLFGTILFAAFAASAQTNFAQSVSFASPGFGVTPVPPVAALPSLASSSMGSPINSSAPAAEPFVPPSPALPAAISSPEPPQEVQGVFNKYNYDVYVGYTFFRFYEVPGIQSNMNGGNFSFLYWYRDHLAADGEFAATYGSQPGINSWQVFYGIGPRYRWIKPKGIDLWVHALVGGDYATPKTPYGGQAALAGLVGGGVDLNGHHRHMAVRIAIDAIGTHYFGTFQASPKLSVGIVYKF